MLPLITDLGFIAGQAVEKEAENDRFREFLRAEDPDQLDRDVAELNREVSAQVDCLKCGNCCRTYMISVLPEEAERLAKRLEMTTENFNSTYTDTGMAGAVINKIPCHFLCADNACRVYSDRPEACRSFPHLEQAGIRQRLKPLLANYGVCPIVYNVLERWKQKLQFPAESA